MADHTFATVLEAVAAGAEACQAEPRRTLPVEPKTFGPAMRHARLQQQKGSLPQTYGADIFSSSILGECAPCSDHLLRVRAQLPAASAVHASSDAAASAAPARAAAEAAAGAPPAPAIAAGSGPPVHRQAERLRQHKKTVLACWAFPRRLAAPSARWEAAGIIRARLQILDKTGQKKQRKEYELRRRHPVAAARFARSSPSVPLFLPLGSTAPGLHTLWTEV